VRIGVRAGLLGGATIWVYEIIVWVHFLQLRTLRGLFENSAVLALGSRVSEWPGPWALILSTAIHFATAAAWGVLFAFLWPALQRRAIEATLAALFFGVFAWIIMHNVVLAAFSPQPPQYTTYTVLNGLVSHTFAFAVPVALFVKRYLR